MNTHLGDQKRMFCNKKNNNNTSFTAEKKQLLHRRIWDFILTSHNDLMNI